MACLERRSCTVVVTRSRLVRLLKQARTTMFRPSTARLVRALWKPPEQVYRHLIFKGWFTTRIAGSNLRLAHHGFQTDNELFWGGEDAIQERVSLATWARLAAHATVIADVGANHGLYSLVARAVNPHAQIFAFEPVGRVHSRLVTNLQMNDFNVVAERLAVSNADGLATLFDLPGEQSLQATMEPSRRREDSVVCTVRTTRLSSYLASKGIERLDLAKVDVEGHEPQVLEGMSPLLERCATSLLVEIQTVAAAQRIADLTASVPYLVFDIDEKGLPRRVERLDRGSSFWNYLLCTEEKARLAGLI